MTHKIYLALAMAFVLLFSSCSQDDTNTGNKGMECGEIERSDMLANYADNLIIPAYERLDSDLVNLQISYDNFKNAPDESNLQVVKADFESAYTTLQSCTAYDFGPALGGNALSTLNVFPTNSSNIESSIESGSYDLASGTMFASIGFPALDYLLYHTTDSAIVAEYSTADNSETRLAYTRDVIIQIANKVAAVLDEWQADYRDQFVASNGTDPSSSLSLLVNGFNRDYENMKNFEIGLPSGRKGLTGATLPEKVQAYHSGNSLQLFSAHLMALEHTFTGTTTSGKDSLGLDDNLEAYCKDELVSDILNQFKLADNQEGNITSPLSEAIATDPTSAQTLYDILQENVANIKSDMPSILSVVISYQDGDGD